MDDKEKKRPFGRQLPGTIFLRLLSSKSPFTLHYLLKRPPWRSVQHSSCKFLPDQEPQIPSLFSTPALPHTHNISPLICSPLVVGGTKIFPMCNFPNLKNFTMCGVWEGGKNAEFLEFEKITFYWL